MATSSNVSVDHRLREYVDYSELKQLAYNIAALQQEKLFHSLAILSFLPGEGKTLFAAAMARAYVDTCHTKVLIVDTTTFQNKQSLALKECFNGSTPFVEVVTLAELRKNTGGSVSPSALPMQGDKDPALDAEIVRGRPLHVTTMIENDFSIIKRVAEDRSKQYGLVLLDTAALQAKNRSNVDPLLVARLSGAAVLVVSRAHLDSPQLTASLKILKDPTLHLIGVISNEGYEP